MDVNSLVYLTMNFTVWKLNAKFNKNIFNVPALAIILTFLMAPLTAIEANQANVVVIGLSNNSQETPFDKSIFAHSYNRSLERTNVWTLNTNGMNEASNPNDSQEHVSEASNSYIPSLSVDKNASIVRNDTNTTIMKAFPLNNTLLIVTLEGENVSIFFGSPIYNDHFDN